MVTDREKKEKNVKTRIIFAFIAAFVLSVIFSAGCLASTIKKELNVPKGGWQSISVEISEQGDLTYDITIDSSDGYIYVYNAKGDTIDTLHYTGASMPAHRYIPVSKGRYTVEITRSADSTGSGDMTASLKCSASKSSSDDSGMLGLMFLFVLLAVLTGGYRYRRRSGILGLLFGRRRYGGGRVNNVMLFRDDFDDDNRWF